MSRYRWIPEEKKWVERGGYKDPNAGLNGPVWCPDGGYFDMALDRRFESKKEKRAYMREKGLLMQGGGKKTKPVTDDKKARYFFMNNK